MELRLYDLEPTFLKEFELVPDEFDLFLEDGVLKANVLGTDMPVIIQDLAPNYKYLFHGTKVRARGHLIGSCMKLIL
jgi:hypothetical protein